MLKIFTFWYRANEESDDIIDGSMKTVQHSIENICTSQKKQTDSGHAIA